MPIITFSIPQEFYDKVKEHAINGESENLAAKRLLLSSIGVEIPKTSLEERLEKLEYELESLKDMIQGSTPKPETENIDPRDIPNTNGYSQNDAIDWLREIIGSNEMTKVNGSRKRTKKECADYLALHGYPGPEKEWNWNARTFNKALEAWGLTWK